MGGSSEILEWTPKVKMSTLEHVEKGCIFVFDDDSLHSFIYGIFIGVVLDKCVNIIMEKAKH